MRRKITFTMLIAAILISGLAVPSMAYPERPDSARVQYEMWYFPIRLISMVTAVVWDVPTATLQDSVRGSIGGCKMVARNLGKEDGVYEMVAGAPTGGVIGAVAGATYGLGHGFFYGAKHGFVGYPSPHSGSHSMLFQGKQYVVPYDDNY